MIDIFALFDDICKEEEAKAAAIAAEQSKEEETAQYSPEPKEIAPKPEEKKPEEKMEVIDNASVQPQPVETD